jgi:hypothetical protein
VPIDDVAEGLFRVIGRLIAHLIVDVLIEIIFYLIGKVFLRIVTFGRYPPPAEQRHSVEFVEIVGFIVVVLAFVALYFNQKQ